MRRSFRRPKFPIEYNPTENLKNQLIEFPVPNGSRIVGHDLYELALPMHTLIVLIRRRGEVLVPKGNTRIEAGDVLLALADENSIPILKSRLQ